MGDKKPQYKAFLVKVDTPREMWDCVLSIRGSEPKSSAALRRFIFNPVINYTRRYDHVKAKFEFDAVGGADNACVLVDETNERTHIEPRNMDILKLMYKGITVFNWASLVEGKQQ